jgi:bifunctional enzyme CysN/CysC
MSSTNGMPSTPGEQLKIVIVGHVDHGKSTFIGRLLHDTGSLPEGKLEQLQQIAKRRGSPFEWANLMDALQAERNQNVTIDTAQIWFRTRKRQYVLIDTPGHEEFLKNMITGAASADAALLLIDAHEGVQENSRRHCYLLNLLDLRQIVVLVNKMDLENYSESRFREIETQYRLFLQSAGIAVKTFIPISARYGDNIASSGQNLPWWRGPSILEALDSFTCPEEPRDKSLRFPVQDVYRFDERRILAGRVESGTLRVGDRLLFSPANKVSTVKSIERWNAPPRDCASAGESIGITLTEQIFVERGDIAALESSPPYELTLFKARVFWLGRQPLELGKKYKLKLTTQEVECEIASIEKVINASTLAAISRPGNEMRVIRNEVGEVAIRTRRPVAFDAVSEIVPTGRFVLVDGYEIAGGGTIVTDNYPHRTGDSSHKSENIYWNRGKVTPDQRALRNGHPGCVVWLTGLSGSGKSTIAIELERQLFNLGRQACVLDGDNMRHGLGSDLGFSHEDRKENIRRAGEVAKLFADAGVICITAFISPYRSDRELARAIAPQGKFLEVYLNVPLEICEQRDTKGLYAKARAGEIKEFTGISAPYEPPLQPEIELPTGHQTVGECVATILAQLNALSAGRA